MPTAQANIADCSTTGDRSRSFVLLGGASFVGFLAWPVFGGSMAGPAMGAAVGEMRRMLNRPALAVTVAGAPLLLLAPLCLGLYHAIVAAPASFMHGSRTIRAGISGTPRCCWRRWRPLR